MIARVGFGHNETIAFIPHEGRFYSVAMSRVSADVRLGILRGYPVAGTTEKEIPDEAASDVIFIAKLMRKGVGDVAHAISAEDICKRIGRSLRPYLETERAEDYN